MATSQVKNVQKVFVGASPALSTLGTLNTGEIGFFNEDGRRIVAAGAGAGEVNSADVSKFKVHIGRASSPDLVSDIIETSSISDVVWKTYDPRANQVVTIGSNGTTGSLPVTASNLYYVRLYIQEFLSSHSDGQRMKHGVYKSAASTSQAEIAIGLAKSIYQNFLREAEQFITVDVLTDHAGVALGTGVNDVVFTKGSNTISAADIDDATTNPALAVGDFLRIGTGVTGPMYKITAIDATANTATLDAPYRGESATIADTGLENVNASNAAGANWGIKLTGADLSFGAPDYKYSVVRWDTQLENFGTTEAVVATGASPGIGTYESIASLEHFCQGFHGEIYRMGAPLNHPAELLATSAVAGGGYDTITFKCSDSKVTGSFSAEVSPKMVTLAFPATAPAYALSSTADGIAELIEDFSGTALNVT
tara:strand:- start:5396 stop:6667 length:1272 start_codon:yes stop_codon:yes gene_type:complete